jgi:hypothetical protein
MSSTGINTKPVIFLQTVIYNCNYYLGPLLVPLRMCLAVLLIWTVFVRIQTVSDFQDLHSDKTKLTCFLFLFSLNYLLLSLFVN